MVAQTLKETVQWDIMTTRCDQKLLTHCNIQLFCMYLEGYPH